MMVQPDLKEQIKRYKNFLRLRKTGATYREIGEMYGITRQAVCGRIRKGVPKAREHGLGASGVMGKAGFTYIKGRGRARMMVRLRDNFTCQDCGVVRNPAMVKRHNKDVVGLKGRMKHLDVHHTEGQCGKNSLGYDSTKDLSGMVTLCHKCHFNRPEHRCKALDFRQKHLGPR